MSEKYSDSPYKKIPDELLNDFTMNQSIPILDWFLDGKNELLKKEWTEEYINEFLLKFSIKNILRGNEGESPYGHDSCINLLQSFLEYNIINKKVAIIGSTTPWIEAILINLNNNVTTVEYNVPDSKFNNLKCIDYFRDFQNTKEMYDVIVSYSSIEHSGLGRYGDPLNPNGDIETIDTIYNNLLENGLLIWGAPVGKDALVWNAHRIYGEKRFPLLFKNFEELEWYGHNKQLLFNQKLANNGYQPVIVFKKNIKK